MSLDGLDCQSARKIFETIGTFVAEEQDWQKLVELYKGNPLALEIAARHIWRDKNKNISKFVRQDKLGIPGELKDLLDEHFARLSEAEKSLMYWLAINREPTSEEELAQDLLRPQRLQISGTFGSLAMRIPLEKTELLSGTVAISLQPVLVEYMTERLTEQVVHEIQTETVQWLRSHALLKAKSADYIRAAQSRLLLAPIVEWLEAGDLDVEETLVRMLGQLPRSRRPPKSYAAGNLLNLLVHLGADVSGSDFSHLAVWQADLRNANLYQVNFAGADLTHSLFAETFGIILCNAFSPDGELLATGDANHDLRLWQIQANRATELAVLAHPQWVWAVAFSPDGQYLASGCTDCQVRLYSRGAEEKRFVEQPDLLEGHRNQVRSLAFSPDSQWLASACRDATVRIWCVQDRVCAQILEVGCGEVHALAFSPDGRWLATGSEQGQVVLFSTETWDRLPALLHEGEVRTVKFAPDGQVLASGSDDRTIKIWEMSTQTCLKTLNEHSDKVFSVAFSWDGEQLASASGDQTIRLWNWRQGKRLKILQGHTAKIGAVAFSPISGSSLLVSGSNDQTIRLWDIQATDEALQVLQGRTYGICDAGFSTAHPCYFASGGEDSAIRFWDTRQETYWEVLGTHRNWAWSVALNQKRQMLACGGGDGLISLWRLPQLDSSLPSMGQRQLVPLRPPLSHHQGWVWCIRFSPDGQLLASASADHTIKLWNVQTWQERTLLGHQDTVRWVSFHPNGDVLASCGNDKSIRIWQIGTGELLQTHIGHQHSVRSIAFSPDGRFLVSASDDLTLKLWRVLKGYRLKTQAQCTFKGHEKPIWAIAVSPDGEMVASASEDHTVKLWHVTTGCCLWTRHHEGQVRSVDFNPAGDALMSGSQDGTVRCWRVETGELLKTWRAKRPYEEMNIQEIQGLTEAQKNTLIALGARVF
jgi:WD40 repeat protein